MKEDKNSELLKQFIRPENLPIQSKGDEVAVSYSRVSSKEQFENNGSLESQSKTIKRFASHEHIPIVAEFGGVYESAATDERKEFQKMLKYIKHSKENIKYIIVSDHDRFSRSGADAIHLVDQLRKKGIRVIAANAPFDTQTSVGVLQQDMQFLWANFDNRQRSERTIRGMKQKYEKGYIIGKAPIGYDQQNINGETVLTINKIGRAIQLAFKWKADHNMKSSEIAKKLNKLGFKIREKQLSRIFRNLVYCGKLSNKMLGDKIVDGKWPPLVSVETFLRANEVLAEAKPSHYDYKRENENTPLKHFIVCDKCATKWTAYLVKKKGLYYYKCNTKGCQCNKSAKSMHEEFISLLSTFEIEKKHATPLKRELEYVFNAVYKNANSERNELEGRLNTVCKQLESLEEKFIENLIDSTTYQKHRSKYTENISQIQRDLQKKPQELSNRQEFIDFSLNLCQNLSQAWVSGDLECRQILQKAIFPEGIAYNLKNGGYRTTKVNMVIFSIAAGARVLDKKKTGNSLSKKRNSPLVPQEGIEPPRPKAHDFESCASTNSATRACGLQM